MIIAGHRVEGDDVVLMLQDGGEIRCHPSLIDRFEPGPVAEPRDVVPRAVRTLGATAERLVSRPYGELIQEAAQVHGVSPILIHALVEVESGYDPTAVSPRGAMGLMQLMPFVAEEYGVHDPFDPASNIQAGTRHLRSLIDRFGIGNALAAYNAGAGSVLKFDGLPPFPETRRYVNRIMDLVDAHQD